MKLFAVPLMLALALAAGCQTITPKSWNFFPPKVKESSYAPPARIAIMWSPAILNQAGKTPTRGFGGRVYFYDAKNTPVPVEGQLVVYAYNNDVPKPDSKVPDRKYAFTPEQFATHFVPTELGASYSIWIPWDEVGKPQAEISLVPVFTSSSGALVMGESSRNLLPGPKSAQPTSYITNCTVPGQGPWAGGQVAPYGVQQASYASPPLPGNLSPPAAVGPGIPQFHEQSGLSTMSITMPGTMADRLALASPQVSLMQRMAQLRQEAMARSQLPGAVGGAHPTSMPAPAAIGLGGVPQPWFPAAPQPVHSALPAQPAPNVPSLPQAAGPPPLQPSR